MLIRQFEDLKRRFYTQIFKSSNAQIDFLAILVLTLLRNSGEMPR